MSDGFNIDEFIKDNIDANSPTGNDNSMPNDLTINSNPMQTYAGQAVQQPMSNVQPTVDAQNSVPQQPAFIDPTAISTEKHDDQVYAPGTAQGNVHFTSEQVAQNGTSQPRISQNDIVAGGVDDGKEEQVTYAEKLKRIEVNYKPPSKFKIFLLIVFFILLVAFVLFLPEISEYVLKYKSGQLNVVEEKITTGKLICTLSSNTANLDLDYKREFKFTDSSLDSAEFTLTTKGSPTEDEATLNAENEKCEKLKEGTKALEGVAVSCEYSDGKLVERQSFNYANVNAEEVDKVFNEVGAVNPDFTAGQDIDKIEKNMYASNYKCTREK